MCDFFGIDSPVHPESSLVVTGLLNQNEEEEAKVARLKKNLKLAWAIIVVL